MKRTIPKLITNSDLCRSNQYWPFIRQIYVCEPLSWLSKSTEDFLKGPYRVFCANKKCKTLPNAKIGKTYYLPCFFDRFLCEECFTEENRSFILPNEDDETIFDILVDLSYFPDSLRNLCQNVEIIGYCKLCKCILHNHHKNIYWFTTKCVHKNIDNERSTCSCASKLMKKKIDSFKICFSCNAFHINGGLKCAKCEKDLEIREENQEWFYNCTLCDGEKEDPNDPIKPHICPGATINVHCSNCVTMYGGLGYTQF